MAKSFNRQVIRKPLSYVVLQGNNDFILMGGGVVIGKMGVPEGFADFMGKLLLHFLCNGIVQGNANQMNHQVRHGIHTAGTVNPPGPGDQVVGFEGHRGKETLHFLQVKPVGRCRLFVQQASRCHESDPGTSDNKHCTFVVLLPQPGS